MKTLDEAIQKLREVADFLSTRKVDEYIFFPGWDPDRKLDEDVKRLRRTAWTIAADDMEPDESTGASTPDLGLLIHYIADMME